MTDSPTARSNGKAIWTKQRPMHDEVVLQNQVNQILD
jgi:hypothetical protein